jgi:branched-chain amino acid transport system substrate-binding protein
LNVQKKSRRTDEAIHCSLVVTTSLVFATSAHAQTLDKVVKVGSLGDPVRTLCRYRRPRIVRRRADGDRDSGLLAKGWKIDLISADHQNKPDVGTNIGKQWIDVEKVDVFVDLASSGVGLAIANLAKEKNVVNLNSGSASSISPARSARRTRSTGSTTPGCSPTAPARRW